MASIERPARVGRKPRSTSKPAPDRGGQAKSEAVARHSLEALRLEHEGLRQSAITAKIDLDILRSQLAEGRAQQEQLNADLQHSLEARNQLETEVARLNSLC